MHSCEIKELCFRAEDDEDQKTQAIMDEIERKKNEKIKKEIEVIDQLEDSCSGFIGGIEDNNGQAGFS